MKRRCTIVKTKKILKIILIIMVILILALVFLLNYNKNKLIDNKTYTILKITNVGTTPAVIAEYSYDHTLRCFKLKSSFNYKITVLHQGFIAENENINYKKYGNFVFHREEIEITESRSIV